MTLVLATGNKGKIKEIKALCEDHKVVAYSELIEPFEIVEDAKQNPDIVNFLVGKVMQKTHGKADPELTLTLLKKNLGIEL